MRQFSSVLAHTIACQLGVVHHDQLVGDGFTATSIRRMITASTLVTVHRQTYRLSTAPTGFKQSCVAACLADPHAFVTGPAAARLWKFRHVPKPQVPIVVVGHDRNPLNHGVIVRRSNMIAQEDIVQRSDGIAVASPPRAWFDCGRDLDDDQFEMLTEWVIDRHAQAPTLWRVVRRLGQQGRPGLARVRRVMSQRPVWQKPAGSGLELRVLKALTRAGLPELVRQYPIPVGDGSFVHPDGADPDLKWAIEIDHVTWHGGRDDAQYDKTRDRRLRRRGWQVERVTDRELREDFVGTIREVVEMYDLRRRQLAA